MKRDVVKRQTAAEFTPNNAGISRNFRQPLLPSPKKTTRQKTSQTGPLWGKIKKKKKM